MKITRLPDEEAGFAMEHGEFSETVRKAAPLVAVILTQDWCPDWKYVERWLTNFKEEDPESTVKVFLLVYNKVPYFNDFRRFKETEFHNALVPYLRYYKDGAFVGDSNQVSEQEFFRYFGL